MKPFSIYTIKNNQEYLVAEADGFFEAKIKARTFIKNKDISEVIIVKYTEAIYNKIIYIITNYSETDVSEMKLNFTNYCRQAKYQRESDFHISYNIEDYNSNFCLSI